jgi:hypothetical protein
MAPVIEAVSNYLWNFGRFLSDHTLEDGCLHTFRRENLKSHQVGM